MIILTGGLAGSSVLTSLLRSSGYWTGESTVKKSDYDTWENSELVALNNQIFACANFNEDWTLRFRPDYVDSFRSPGSKIDDNLLTSFIRKCDERAPWVWKDPRLWLTIWVWRKHINFNTTVFLVIRRELMQSWISTTIRRQVQTIGHLKRYDAGVHGVIIEFLEQNSAAYVDILYEELICNPESVIGQINDLTNSRMTLENLKSVFRGKLYRKQHGMLALVKASAIYAKNFRRRYR